MGVVEVGVADVFKNLGKVAKNKTTSMFQNPDQLKTDSLILASLVLVISRIVVANLSAIKAMGSTEGPFRYKLAVQTDIREICGWTFGFVVLRQIQNWVKKKIAAPMGIRKIGEPPKYPLWSNVRNAFTKAGPNPLHLGFAAAEKLDYNPAAVSVKLREFLTKSPWARPIFTKLGKTEAECMKTLFRAVPIAIGSVPAVILAGYALERFTRDYSDHVVDVVSKTFKTSGKGMGSKPKPANSESKPFSPSAAQEPQAPVLSLNSAPQNVGFQSQPPLTSSVSTLSPIQQPLLSQALPHQPLPTLPSMITAPSFAGLNSRPMRPAMAHRNYYPASLQI